MIFVTHTGYENNIQDKFSNDYNRVPAPEGASCCDCGRPIDYNVPCYESEYTHDGEVLIGYTCKDCLCIISREELLTVYAMVNEHVPRERQHLWGMDKRRYHTE